LIGVVKASLLFTTIGVDVLVFAHAKLQAILAAMLHTSPQNAVDVEVKKNQ
jgi:hypothetical protein